MVHAKCRSGLCYSQQLPTSSAFSHWLGKKTNAVSMRFLQGKRHHAACIQGKLETVSCQADWGKKETLIECYQKCCRYCLLYILQSGEKKKSPCKCGKRKERSRDSPLMSIWRVFCLSRDLFVLLLIPQSSIPLSLCEKKMLPGREARHGLLTGTANWIQLAWPEIFLHIWTVTKSFRVAPWVCI